MGERRTVVALGLVVGLVLADSSVVILALPDILDHFNVSIDHVAWVLTLFNLVLAVVAVPASYLSRRFAPGVVCSGGLLLFAAASLGCALAPDFTWLLVFRAGQAVGGAAAVCAALELLSTVAGSEKRAVGVWAAAGGLGAAAGPAVGGVLTDAISWQAIFFVQVPLALAALVLIPRRSPKPAPLPVGRPALAANVSLALLSAALTAALFLVVLLLINGWGHTPLAAAAVVTVMPLAAFATYRLVPANAPSARIRAICGAILIAGGLAALALLPAAAWGWLVLPQVAIGVGFALVAGRAHAGRAGRPLAARHPRRLDAGRPPRRGLPGPPDPDADLHRRPGRPAERRRAGRHPADPRLLAQPQPEGVAGLRHRRPGQLRVGHAPAQPAPRVPAGG